MEQIFMRKKEGLWDKTYSKSSTKHKEERLTKNPYIFLGGLHMFSERLKMMLGIGTYKYF